VSEGKVRVPTGTGPVGASAERADARSHVTGHTVFVDDVRLPRMAHMVLARSPFPHALIRSIDLGGAKKVPGFIRALTAADVPKNVYTILGLIGFGLDEERALANERVRYVGEPIVAVIAETRAGAAEAAKLVRIEYEELAAVFDVEEALAPGAPAVTEWGINAFEFDGRPFRQVRFGDVDAAMARADHVVEGRYQMSPIEHAPVETTGCVARPEPDGRFTVWTNTQALNMSLDLTAHILQIPTRRLRFIGGTVGGGFGGKVDAIVEPLATLGAWKTGRPVKYVYSREEEMIVSSTRNGVRIYMTDGVTNDGLVVARRVRSYIDCGAYSRHTPYAVQKHAANLAGPYFIPNASFDIYCVYTNRQPSSAMRGFGVTEASFAMEVQMDRIAELTGLDPWTVRFRNAYHDGDLRPHRKPVEDATLIEAMQAAARLVGHELSPELLAMSSKPREV
jgi:CO/xanthine dehydrogenase Mo-binding subunit